MRMSLSVRDQRSERRSLETGEANRESAERELKGMAPCACRRETKAHTFRHALEATARSAVVLSANCVTVSKLRSDSSMTGLNEMTEKLPIGGSKRTEEACFPRRRRRRRVSPLGNGGKKNPDPLTSTLTHTHTKKRRLAAAPRRCSLPRCWLWRRPRTRRRPCSSSKSSSSSRRQKRQPTQQPRPRRRRRHRRPRGGSFLLRQARFRGAGKLRHH